MIVEKRRAEELITPKVELKRTTASDLPVVWDVISKCSENLSEQGLSHWSKYYTEDMVGKMIAKKEVYLGVVGETTVGTVTIGGEPPKYYEDPGYGDRFTKTDEPVIYITALAVLPDYQKQGFAGQMLRQVEELAVEKKASWLRLDCRIEVPGLVAFYEKNGFKKLGDFPVDEGEDGTYWFMEKKISN